MKEMKFIIIEILWMFCWKCYVLYSCVYGLIVFLFCIVLKYFCKKWLIIKEGMIRFVVFVYSVFV